MGRIEDALRRSGESGTPGSSIPTGDEVFVSPWAVSAPPESLSDGVAPEVVRDFSDEFDGAECRQPQQRADLVTGSDTADAALSGQFRRMAARLYNLRGQADIKAVMVTSAEPGEGKTTTAMNLAQILSQSFRERVLLVDADLRRPSIHRTWGIDVDRGLSDVLGPSPPDKLPVVHLSETLTLLPAGRPDADPTGGLTSEAMRRTLAEARSQFDWVILDTPPIGAVDDATLLGSMVDAVLFVVRARKTRFPVVRTAIDSIGRDRLFGVVLNGTEVGDSPGYGYYHYGSSA